MQSNRIEHIDYLKCVCIVLMVLIHIVYWGNMHQYPKAIILTFIMPVFLFISGYFTNADKPLKDFIGRIRYLLAPYIIMESGYILMASVLPIREHIENLTPAVFFDRLLLHPLGPYWYLHTVIICSVVYYGINRIGYKMNTVSFISVFGFIMWGGIFEMLHLAAIENVLYFIAGVMTRRCGKEILSIFRPSFVTVFPLAALCMYHDSMNRGTTVGVFLCYFVVCLLLAIYNILPQAVKPIMFFIGRNTLAVLLFSPMFTILTKPFVTMFSFDPTATVYAMFAVSFSVAGSLSVAWMMDFMQLSRLFYGKRRMINR